MKKFYLFVLMAAMLQVSTLMDAQVRYPDSRAGLMNPQQRVVAVNGHENYVDGDEASITNADRTLYFSTMDLAIQSIEDGDVVTLKALKDATVTKELNVKNDMFVTLDLNGKELVIQNYKMSVNKGGTSAARLDIVDLSGTNKGKLKFLGTKAYLYIQGAQTDQSDYSVLNIGAGVTISQDNYYALGVFNKEKITQNGKEVGPAFGVKIDIYGTVISKYGLTISGNVQALGENVPTITIKEGGLVGVGDENAAIYAAGYGNWIIEGTVQGGIGVYAKAGNVTVQGDGKVVATAKTYIVPEPNGNGYEGGDGCAIVQDSKNGYAGGMTLIVKDNATIESQTSGGYAIQEIKTDALNTKTESIVIKGGTIKGNLDTTAELKDVIIDNGTITGGTFDTDVTEYLNNITGVITPVPGENGKTLYVVGEKPVSAPDWINDINAATADSYVRLNGNGEQTLTKDIEATYLVMQGADDKVVVPAGKTLSVGEVVMGANAVIEVEAGATLIVNDKNGIVANNENNIVIRTQEGKPGQFLLNPAVTSNKNPKATVEFVAKSFYVNGNDYQFVRFGIPTWTTLESIECKEGAENTGIYVFEGNGWKDLGYLKKGTAFTNVSSMNKPFAACNLIAYQSDRNVTSTYVMKGNLMGNSNASLNADKVWTPLANSYTANVDMVTLLAGLEDNATNVEPTVYLATPAGLGTYTWNAFDSEWADGEKLAPMQAFILKNNGAEAEVNTIDYTTMVWNPGTGKTSAPVRRVAGVDNSAKMRIVVANENGVWDNVKMTENAVRTSESEKYMNDDVNIYVQSGNKLGILASNDLENTYLGFSSVKGGNFTISFANVEGREFTLVDMETGAEVAVEEGNTYSFKAAAKTSSDYRFRLVGRRNAATAIDNVESVKAAAGIYSITGQYIGEVNMWNALPAGVYVVDGVKRVK